MNTQTPSETKSELFGQFATLHTHIHTDCLNGTPNMCSLLSKLSVLSLSVVRAAGVSTAVVEAEASLAGRPMMWSSRTTQRNFGDDGNDDDAVDIS